MSVLENKKVMIIGDRDGVPGPAIEECVKTVVRRTIMSVLENKKVMIIGDRDGVPGPAIEECVKTVDSAEVIFSATECFV